MSANPTGPLHSGHGRQVILGATIANLLEWTGHAVTRGCSFNNAGNQIRNLAESIYARSRQSLGDDYPFPEQRKYQGEYISEIAREIKAEKGDSLGESDSERSYFKKTGEAWQLYDKITKTLTHDSAYGMTCSTMKTRSTLRGR